MTERWWSYFAFCIANQLALTKRIDREDYVAALNAQQRVFNDAPEVCRQQSNHTYPGEGWERRIPVMPPMRAEDV
jgi:hypothetical protein